MNGEIEKIARAIAEDITEIALLALNENDKAGTTISKDNLKDTHFFQSVKAQVQSSDNVVIETLFQPYINYVEWDLPPKHGNPPPISDIIEWAKRKGVSTDNEVVRNISDWLWETGHSGRPVIEMFTQLLEQQFNEHWADSLFNAIIDKLTKFFN